MASIANIPGLEIAGSEQRGLSPLAIVRRSLERVRRVRANRERLGLPRDADVESQLTIQTGIEARFLASAADAEHRAV
jgi:hypothetical protein